MWTEVSSLISENSRKGRKKILSLQFSHALRFDDTNPTKEKTEFVESIIEDVKWLGADFEDLLFFASNYFQQMYECAVLLIKKGKAFVVFS